MWHILEITFNGKIISNKCSVWTDFALCIEIHFPHPKKIGLIAVQTWKKLIFSCKPIFGVGKYPHIHIVSQHIKMPRFAIYQIFSNKNGLIVDNNADLWALMCKNCNKMSTIFSKIVCKHYLHACDFFHVCFSCETNAWIRK